MAKQVILNELRNELWYLKPNYQRRTEDNATEYCPWALELNGVVMGDGVEDRANEVITFGAWRTEQYTPQERYNFIKNAASLNTVFINAMKTLYINAINEDISQ